MKIKRYDIITTLLCLCAVLPPVFVYGELPQQVPLHFGMDGKPDSFAPKIFAVFALPVIMAICQFVCCVCSNAREKEGTIPKEMNMVVRTIIPILCITVQTAITMYCLNRYTDIFLIVNCIVGVMFIAIGNYLPKCRRNSIVGIKIPPTLKSDHVWEKTHRLAGFVMVIGGFSSLIVGFIGLPILTLVIFSIVVIVPVVYAFSIKDA